MGTKNTNPQDHLINFAIQELSRVLSDMKQGKEPEMSSSMQKIAAELEMANANKKNMSEEEIKQWADRIAKEVPDLED